MYKGRLTHLSDSDSEHRSLRAPIPLLGRHACSRRLRPDTRGQLREGRRRDPRCAARGPLLSAVARWKGRGVEVRGAVSGVVVQRSRRYSSVEPLDWRANLSVRYAQCGQPAVVTGAKCGWRTDTIRRSRRSSRSAGTSVTPRLTAAAPPSLAKLYSLHHTPPDRQGQD